MKPNQRADGAREAIPGKEETPCGHVFVFLRSHSTHKTCANCSLSENYVSANWINARLEEQNAIGYTNWRRTTNAPSNYFSYKAGYDAGSSQVAALTEKAYNDGLAEGRRTYQTDLAELTRRNEQLEAALRKVCACDKEWCLMCGIDLLANAPVQHVTDCPMPTIAALLEKRTQP
jgi:hypothetical protein